MDRTTLYWTLGLFFGASIAFRAVQDLTADRSTAFTLAAEGVVLVVLIAGVVFFVRRSGRR